MSAHVVFAAAAADLPATLCHSVMSDLLAQDLGFAGLRISDCLQMQAIADGGEWGGTVGGALAALAAGNDLVLISHDHGLVEQFLLRGAAALAAGDLDPARVAQAISRVDAVLAAYAASMSPPSPSLCGSARHRAIVDQVAGGDAWSDVDPTAAPVT
jgi:beta-N-acetylhexosaminidase